MTIGKDTDGPPSSGMDAHTASPIFRGKEGDRLRQLRAFCYTARLRSFSQAAEHLFSSQSSVSQQVRALEREFAVLLLDRSSPRLSLTPAGRELYRTALPVVVGMDRLPDTFADLHYGVASGEMHIAAGQATAEVVLPGYLERFCSLYPGIEVHVRTDQGNERLRWLRDYEVDLVIGTADVVHPTDLEFRFLFASDYVLITPEDHPLAGRGSVTLQEACAHPAIVPPRGSVVRPLMDLFARKHGLVIDAAVEIGGWDTIKRYVEAGLGIAVVPDICLAEQDRIGKVPISWTLPARRYGIFMRHGRTLSPVSRRFIRIMDPNFPEEA